jgi:succinate dehydrogenase / fumarate reductase, flavoprotein subunit
MDSSELEEYYDAVIVGSGAAGLSATLALLRTWQDSSSTSGTLPKVLVISKLQALRAHTGSAEGGIAASLGNVDKDDWHWHYFDTIKGGDWLVDQDAARLLAEEAPSTVIRLEHDGVAFSRTPDGHIAQRRFGGHTSDFGGTPVRRAAFAADRIGHQILHSLWQQCVALGVHFAEDWYVCDLSLDTRDVSETTGAANVNRVNRVNGVITVDTRTGTVRGINGTHVVMATGGAGRLFTTTSNSWDLTGDGLSLALNAGLQIEDAEFIQFHPTGLAHTGILLSEAARAEGGVLRNADGEAFMARYAPEHADLAARDVVCRAIREEVLAGRGVPDPRQTDGPKDCVWLDLRALDPDHMEATLPQVCETIRDVAGLDPSKDLIPVKPTAHYTMGGIPIDTSGRVYTWENGERHVVGGLYAAGECSCVGVHGANRLGGNSLLDACLFGTHAGESIARDLLHDVDGDSNGPDSGHSSMIPPTDITAWQERLDTLLHPTADDNHDQATAMDEQEKGLRASTHNSKADGFAGADADNAYRVMADLGALMEEHVAVSCDQQSIDSARHLLEQEFSSRVRRLKAHSESAAYNQELIAIFEAEHLFTLSKAVLNAMAARLESRGSLKRRDYPERDDTRFLAHSMIDTEGKLCWQPVHILDVPTARREY